MATEQRTTECTIAPGDPDASPFELQPIEGLPLTSEERRELSSALQQLDLDRGRGRTD